MMPTASAIYTELARSLQEVELQIKHVKNDIAIQYPPEKRDSLNVWYWTRNPDGTYVLADLLCAKASIVSSMANLKAADAASKAPRR